MFVGEAASAAWDKLSQRREQEPGPPSIFLQAYFTRGVFGWPLSLLFVCQVKTNQVGQNKVCRDWLRLVGLARHSGYMLNFPLQNGKTSVLLTKPSKSAGAKLSLSGNKNQAMLASSCSPI